MVQLYGNHRIICLDVMRTYIIVFAFLAFYLGSACATTTKAGLTYTELEDLRVVVLEHAVRTGKVPTTDEGLASVREGDGRAPRTVDAWGETFIYHAPSLSSDRLFDLYSKGTNRVDDHGGGDDIVYWEYRGYYSGRIGITDTALAAIVLFDGPILIVIGGVWYVCKKVRHRCRESSQDVV